jgi:hypothetical protein
MISKHKNGSFDLNFARKPEVGTEDTILARNVVSNWTVLMNQLNGHNILILIRLASFVKLQEEQ